jgi:uncharacterized protein (TIGR02466 family)
VAKGDLHKLGIFSTPLFIFEKVDLGLDADLKKQLLDEREKSPGLTRHNVGGWQSRPDLSQRPDLCYQGLMQAVVDRLSASIIMLAEEADLVAPEPLRYDVHAWATVMRDGDYMIPHDHSDAHWSIVYYVDAGDTDLAAHPESGGLTLVDPRRAGRPMPGIDLFPARFLVKPRTGMLVIFPAWLQHYVHAYRGQRPRIAISANLTVLPPVAPA